LTSGPDPIEPTLPANATFTRIKSPAGQMHFTTGLPIRLLGEAQDINAWMCPPGHPPYVCRDSSMTFFVDGYAVGTVAPDPDNFDLWEVRVRSLPVGDHVISEQFVAHDPANGAGLPRIAGVVPVTIHVDPLPARARTIALTRDLVLSGSTPLDWRDAVVQGNGFVVRSTTDYAGEVTIANAFVTGLGSYSRPGLAVTTTGAVNVTQSIFEATAPLQLTVNRQAPVTLSGNEFRANNLLTWTTNNPEATPILDLAGSTTGAKRFIGNNVGAGLVRISGMNGWQIGGMTPPDSNVFMGPRAVLEIDNATSGTIQGNYIHHDYKGGWSQGYNLDAQESAGLLAEHNVFREGSWVIQSFGGEFRYNLVLDGGGHDSWRTAAPKTSIHHNVFGFLPAPSSGQQGMFNFYSGETGIAIDHNTLDGAGVYQAPVVALSGGSTATLTNNITTGFPHMSDSTRFAQGAQIPYAVDEGLIWLRRFSAFDVLACYRGRYMPTAPNRAGAIGAGDSLDLFGMMRFSAKAAPAIRLAHGQSAG
jgi:hypothetical protein